MTAGDAMVEFAVTFYETFATVAVLFLALGVLIGVSFGVSWGQRRAEVKPTGLGSWDTSGWLAESGTVTPFERGVAKVGDAR